MSSDKLALTLSSQPAHTARTADLKQFVDKLYHMVDDPAVDHIHWSDSGDSFIVSNPEKLSKEVLGDWFKHEKFESFVRNLNLYGFRKVSNLQQGTLHGGNSAPLCYENLNFRRGQPELLKLIIRKQKAAAARAEPDAVLDKPSSSSRALAGVTQSEVDNLLGDIATIRHTQATISSELAELKKSQQMLWQEAVDSRGRQQRQQATINQIVKFLGSVFSASCTVSPALPQVKEAAPQEPRVASSHRGRKRRMIEASTEDDAEGVRFVEQVTPRLEQQHEMEPGEPLMSPPAQQRLPIASSASRVPFTPTARTYVNSFDLQPVAGPSRIPDSSVAAPVPMSAPVWTDAALGTTPPNLSSVTAANAQATQPQFDINAFVANLLAQPAPADSSGYPDVNADVHSQWPPPTHTVSGGTDVQMGGVRQQSDSNGTDMSLDELLQSLVPADAQPQYDFGNPHMQMSGPMDFGQGDGGGDSFGWS
ncbi:hypothetical protein BKA62DRAFT_708826 [Auriculariales sp. MPI-PUGE-AT-0066]|nr:hypothetical protein BKA62DRAFT_708826 [Auriculariales sp. MPI-PUGE-AT-0066]